MLRPDRRLGTMASAALLCLLTLSVFASQVSGGPESVIRRFHEAVAKRNRRAVERELLQPLDDNSSQAMIYATDYYLARCDAFEVYKNRSLPRSALFEVQYSRNGYAFATTFWKLDLVRGQWKIDSTGSLGLLRSHLNSRP